MSPGRKPAALSWRTLDGRHDGQAVVLHIDLDADAVERATQVGIADFTLTGRLVNGVRIADRVHHALDRAIDQLLVIDLILVVELALDDPPGLPEDAETLLLIGAEHAVLSRAGRRRLENVQERESTTGWLAAPEQVAADERQREGEQRYDGRDDNVGKPRKRAT